MPDPLLAGDQYRRLCRARDFAAASFDRPVVLAAMADVACLSPWHFHRLFAAAFGETPAAFVTRLRIEAAKRLLAAENLSVTDACLEVGYASLGSFSARFHAATGYPPLLYRREVRRLYGTAARWRFAMIPACYLGHFAGIR